MLNFRKLRRDFSSNILQEGKELFDQKAVISAKIISMDKNTISFNASIKGSYDNVYECEIEIDRSESDPIDSNCDCAYEYDCQHIVAFLFYLENHFNELVLTFSKETDLERNEQIDEEVKKDLKETFQSVAIREEVRKDLKYQKEILREYIYAAKALSENALFLPQSSIEKDLAELAIIFTSVMQEKSEKIFCSGQPIEFQLALRLPVRSKPFYIPNVKVFLEGVLYEESIVLNGKNFLFTMDSFSEVDKKMIELLLRYTRYNTASNNEDKFLRFAYLHPSNLGVILSQIYDFYLENKTFCSPGDKKPFPGIFCGNLEEPLYAASSYAKMKVSLDYFETPYRALLMTPSLVLDEEDISLEQVAFLESDIPGVIYGHTYYRFLPNIRRKHVCSLIKLRDITIPEGLFGSFRENALSVLQSYSIMNNISALSSFITLPYIEELKAECNLSYLDGELGASLFFIYGEEKIPAAASLLNYQHIQFFISDNGILARNLVEEKKILEEVFSEFTYDDRDATFLIRSEKKIVEFMTEVIPNNQHRIVFNCPENLLEQFVYDETTFDLHFQESDEVNCYEVKLKVNGLLKGVSIDLLTDCISSKKRFLELPKTSNISSKRVNKRNQKYSGNKLPRILVLDLDKISPLVQIFSELGLEILDDMIHKSPLWSLTNIEENQFHKLPVNFSITDRLLEIQKQIRGEVVFNAQEIPEQINATLRNYQIEGVHWLERLRKMHLNGILADDMGLGKTLQAIIAITQSQKENPGGGSLVICPTSLVYNWKEEIRKFNPNLNTLVIDGAPNQRKKQLKNLKDYNVIITSYNLLQKDIEIYKEALFDYVILDEAHHIKNRATRNAKSVKMLQAGHRLILTGTPIENSLEELWSLFDFLMPGLLSSYDRFVGKYIRACNIIGSKSDNLEILKKKVSPFILRRMKEDVLEDLPPVSEILYHCHLTDYQKELYQSYAASAKVELSKLVKKEGFDRIHIHVLATLTRLKQICCHPAIFAKDNPEIGDSAKYDMLMELLFSLIGGGHKTVVFSQYTKMLNIIKKDLEQRGVPFAYLDGSTKNRLNVVNQFNEDERIAIFLVSLKAGGTGLNLVGADTVIHYDMWWNPAVENQATDRVRRIGQKRSVSSYKLVTLNTIEEKILHLQSRKNCLVKQVINSDDEVISKLTWEEVLELLQT